MRHAIGRWGHGTDVGGAVRVAESLNPDRIIVITDEQSATRVGDPRCSKAYMINVAPHRNGIGYGAWAHIDGFSESVLRFIREVERERG